MSAYDRSHTDGAQRWASILVGLAIVVVVGWMTLEARGPRPIKQDADAAAVASAVASAAPASTDAGALVATEDLDAGLFLPTLSLGDAGLVMPSGAPRSVKIGVVLVTFSGAEGAPPNARSKKDAQTIADRLGAEARTDFHGAV
ncbi:MAG: Peptidyl-prolyl cis-trans isomerase PpiD, partial [Labilithrix sp.]|nr:Peptidyl-prolyl cis-trans isomerase PpiD [Labilithrix sp.]